MLKGGGGLTRLVTVALEELAGCEVAQLQQCRAPAGSESVNPPVNSKCELKIFAIKHTADKNTDFYNN